MMHTWFLCRPRPDPYTQPGYQYGESHIKAQLPGNNLTPAKMTKPLKTEQVNKPKPGTVELFSTQVLSKRFSPT
jgi:hypothetical protein